MSTPTPPDLPTVVATLRGAADLLGQRANLSAALADHLARLAGVLEPLQNTMQQLTAVDAQIKAANIDQTVAALKAFQDSLGGDTTPTP